jgi:hypothetical protein
MHEHAKLLRDMGSELTAIVAGKGKRESGDLASTESAAGTGRWTRTGLALMAVLAERVTRRDVRFVVTAMTGGRVERTDLGFSTTAIVAGNPEHTDLGLALMGEFAGRIKRRDTP